MSAHKIHNTVGNDDDGDRDDTRFGNAELKIERGKKRGRERDGRPAGRRVKQTRTNENEVIHIRATNTGSAVNIQCSARQRVRRGE